MRQVFVGNAGADDAAAGTVRLESQNSDGQWVTYAGYVAGQNLRVVQHASGDIAKRISPVFKAADCTVTNQAAVAAIAQLHTITATAPGTAGAKATFKVIDTTPGYEPFTRYQVEFVCGANNNATAAALKAAIDVERLANAKFAAAVQAPAVSSAIITMNAVVGLNLEVAVDAGDMADALTFTHVKSAGNAGIGEYATVKKMEELQFGREHTDYDQLVTFRSMPAQVAAEVGSAYHLTTISFKNDYKGGVGQINGVDNFRDLYVFLKEDAAADPYGAKTGTDGTEGWFFDIATSKLIPAASPFFDDL